LPGRKKGTKKKKKVERQQDWIDATEEERDREEVAA